MTRTTRFFHNAGAWVGPAALIVWLETLVWLLAAGRYKAYLKPGLAPFLIFAAVVVFAFLLAFLVSGSMGRGRARPGTEAAKALLLILPVVYLYAVHGRMLGGSAFQNRVVGTSMSVAGPAPTTPGPGPSDPPSSERVPPAPSPPGLEGLPDTLAGTTLLDIAVDAPKYDGRPVTVAGMVFRDGNTPEGSFVLFRFVITCCAADATPVWALVRWPEAAELANDGWMKVEGVLNIEDFKGGKVPVIQAQGLTAMPEPPVAERYLFFAGS